MAKLTPKRALAICQNIDTHYTRPEVKPDMLVQAKEFLGRHTSRNMFFLHGKMFHVAQHVTEFRTYLFFCNMLQNIRY